MVRLLLIGSRDDHSPLKGLSARPLRLVGEHLVAAAKFDACLRWLPHLYVQTSLVQSNLGEVGNQYAAIVGHVEFPAPKGIYVNMMPIILGCLGSVPSELRGYNFMIQKCPVSNTDLEQHKIGYLTIYEMEAPAEAGELHRRGGVHCEGLGWRLELWYGLTQLDLLPRWDFYGIQ